MSKAATFYDFHRSFSKRAFGPLLCVLILFYLGFHTVSGDRGVFALFTETHRLAALKEELALVTAQREALDKKVHLLSDNSLDLDMLDEEARATLGMVGKNEAVIFLDKDSK